MKNSTTIFWLITFSKLEGKIQLAVEETIFKFVYVALHLSRCLAILKVLFLLREDQFSIFELSIQPSIKCENVLLEKPSNLLQKWATFILSQWKMLQLKQMILFKRFRCCWQHLTFLTQSSPNSQRQHFYLSYRI